MHRIDKRWMFLVATAGGVGVWAVAAVHGYGWQMIWLPAVMAGAGWPVGGGTAGTRCLRRLDRRPNGEGS